MLELMMPAPALPVAEPLWLTTNLDKSGWSWGKIGIVANGDGTWSINTGDSVGGYCGHGGPFYGEHASLTSLIFLLVSSIRFPESTGEFPDIPDLSCANFGLLRTEGVAHEATFKRQ